SRWPRRRRAPCRTRRDGKKTLSLWQIPPLGILEKAVALNPGTARRSARDFRIREQAAYSRYRVSIPGRVEPEHRDESAKVNGAGPKVLKKLNVFARTEDIFHPGARRVPASRRPACGGRHLRAKSIGAIAGGASCFQRRVSIRSAME